MYLICPWDVLSLGRFVSGTFYPWDVLSLGTCCMCIVQFFLMGSATPHWANFEILLQSFTVMVVLVVLPLGHKNICWTILYRIRTVYC